jgi:hypothetical protein
LAQWKRLPFTAVFGRTFLPVLGMFFAIETPLIRRQPDLDPVPGSGIGRYDCLVSYVDGEGFTVTK